MLSKREENYNGERRSEKLLFEIKLFIENKRSV